LGTINYVSKWNGATSQTNSQIFDNGTNVGIGTEVPGQKLSVADTLSITNSSGWQSLLMGNQNSNGVNNPAMLKAANGDLYVGHGSSWLGNGGSFTPNVKFQNNGNVGIGDTTPNQKLVVNGNIATVFNIHAGQYCDAGGNNCKAVTAMGSRFEVINTVSGA